ncbi:unnamed protein product [Rhodiola kirilowii]
MADQERNQLPAKPHFLQPVVSDLATNFLIPADFIKYLEDEGREEAQLRTGRRKRPWAVRIVGRRVVDGWEEFVRENELHVGDFLVFRYEGDMVFDVTVIGPTACQKEYPPLPDDDDDVVVEEEEDCGGTLELEEIKRRRSYSSHKAGMDSYVRTMRESYMRNLYFPRAFILHNELKKARSGILMKDENGKIWPIELCFKNNTNVVYTKNIPWRSIVKESGIREGEDFEIRVISKGIKPVLSFRRISEKDKGEMSENGNRQKAGQVFEPQIELEPTTKRQKAEMVPDCATEKVFTPANKQKVTEDPEMEEVAAIPATSDGDQKNDSSSAGGSAYFYQTSTWPAIERSRMNVNIDFARANDLTNKCGNIILKNLKGESWAAKLKYERKKSHDCYYIGVGWKEFALSNGLGVGCRFKLEIEQPERKLLTLKLCECTPEELKLEDNA